MFLATLVPNQSTAILVIGHSPQIDWIIDQIVRPPRRLTRLFSYFPSGLAPGEIACIALDRDLPRQSPPRGQLIWTLDPSPLDPAKDDTYEKLLAKIRSKMESAKMLGSIVAAGLTFVLGTFKDLVPVFAQQIAYKAGSNTSPNSGGTTATGIASQLDMTEERAIFFVLAMTALLAATAMYFSAYISYDRLLMPRRFWVNARSAPARWRGIAWRPPSSVILITYQNMQRVWVKAFIPAVIVTMLGLLSLAYAAVVQVLALALQNVWEARIICILAGVAIAVVVIYCRLGASPILGTQD
jgi:hypothetical protein